MCKALIWCWFFCLYACEEVTVLLPSHTVRVDREAAISWGKHDSSRCLSSQS